MNRLSSKKMPRPPASPFMGNGNRNESGVSLVEILIAITTTWSDQSGSHTVATTVVKSHFI